MHVKSIKLGLLEKLREEEPSSVPVMCFCIDNKLTLFNCRCCDTMYSPQLPVIQGNLIFNNYCSNSCVRLLGLFLKGIFVVIGIMGHEKPDFSV